MILPAEISFPGKTIFKKNAYLAISGELLEYGKNGLIVHGASLERSGKEVEIYKQFSSSSKVAFYMHDTGEPDLDTVADIIRAAREINASWIAGIGGGSVLDLAKAAAGLFNAKEKPEYYQGGGKLKEDEKGIPFIAVPTVPGSGAEVTPNAVVANGEKRNKMSIRDAGFIAKKVILDVALLKGLPARVISHSGMDLFVQAYESFTSRNATWFSETLALKALELANSSILPAYEKQDEKSLTDLLAASYLCGIAFASSRLGVIHGLAHPLGILYGVSHGLVCSVCLLPSIELNRDAMGEKYDVMSGVLGMDFKKRVADLLSRLNVLSPFKGKETRDGEFIISETLKSGSTAASPKNITRDDVEYLLRSLF
ncbi:MAG TPA: iron-containing alcohol dehydrogenase [Candidatus Omnitrophota bacterium]|nr:iron-containing alcohol dehydrogenase [Candidatus Omnitrophota bacterium]HPS19815.1 iron-containing alcohol dehydrogenase [Candidatus Omnitrophota bacterium]